MSGAAAKVRSGATRVALAGLALLFGPCSVSADPCADAVELYLPGEDGGFHSELLPDIALGVPYGNGMFSGSADVVSLGHGGSVTLVFEDNEIIDGPGDDFRVFENAFSTGPTSTFVEAGIVSVSADGVTFVRFPFSTEGFSGLAGVSPVHSHPDNGIDPRTPAAGGDGFDLGTVGVSSARFVRIEDGGDAIPDPGNAFPIRGVGQSGFDLDAVVATHSRERCAGCCDLNGDGAVTIDDAVFAARIVSGAIPPDGACGPVPCRATHCADVDADATVGADDLRKCLENVVALPISCSASSRCDLS